MSTLLTPAADSPASTEPASLAEPASRIEPSIVDEPTRRTERTRRVAAVRISRSTAAPLPLTRTGRRLVAGLAAAAVLLVAAAGGAVAHHSDAASARAKDDQRNAALHTLDGMRRDYHTVRSRVSASQLPHVRHLIVTEYRTRHRDQTITEDAGSAWVAVSVGSVCVEHDLRGDAATSASGSASVSRHGHCEP